MTWLSAHVTPMREKIGNAINRTQEGGVLCVFLCKGPLMNREIFNILINVETKYNLLKM